MHHGHFTTESCKTNPASLDDVARTWQLIARDLRPDECIELRTFEPRTLLLNQPSVAYAVTEQEFRDLVAQTVDAQVTGYVGVNPRSRERYDLAPGLWSEAKGRCSGNTHVTRRCYIFLDCDPVRAEGFEKFNATEEEKRALIGAVDEMRAALPLGDASVADSGNGLYLLARVDLPNDEAINRQVAQWYKAAQARFNGPALRVDSTFDPARIMKVVGARVSGKEAAADRPDRLSKWIDVELDARPNEGLHAAIRSCESRKAGSTSAGETGGEAEESWFEDGPPPHEKLKHARARDVKVAALLDGQADWLRDQSGSGRDMALTVRLTRLGWTPNEIYCVLRWWPHGSKSEAKKNGKRYFRRTMERALASKRSVGLDDLSDLIVLGEDAKGRVVLFNRKTRTLRNFNIAQLKFEDLLQIGGEQVLQLVAAPGGDAENTDLDGIILKQASFTALRRAIAVRAGLTKLGHLDEVGNGIWPLDDGLLLVGDDVAALRPDGTTEQITTPIHQGRFIRRDPCRSMLPVQDLLNRCAKVDQARSREATVRLAQMLGQWTLRNPTDAWLLAGLTLATPFQAAWNWRPQVWVTGPTNAAKSLLLNFLKRVLGSTAHLIEGKTSEAGLRQDAGVNTEPHLLDEFDSISGYHRQNIIEFARSAGPGGWIVKGTPGHSPVRFRVNFMLWFASIEVPLERAADANRFIVFELDELKHHIDPPDTPGVEERGLDLLAALLKFAPRARALEERLSTVAVEGMQGRLVRNMAVPAAVIGTLLGLSDQGAERLLCHWLRVHGQDEVVPQVSDEERLVAAIMSSHVADNLGKPVAVGSLIERDCSLLEPYGIRTMPDQSGIFLAPDAVRRHLLRGTRWADLNIRTILKRLPGVKCDQQRVAGTKTRGLALPWAALGFPCRGRPAVSEGQSGPRGVDRGPDAECAAG